MSLHLDSWAMFNWIIEREAARVFNERGSNESSSLRAKSFSRLICILKSRSATAIATAIAIAIATATTQWLCLRALPALARSQVSLFNLCVSRPCRWRKPRWLGRDPTRLSFGLMNGCCCRRLRWWLLLIRRARVAAWRDFCTLIQWNERS